MRPYEEIDRSIPDLGVTVLPGRLAAVSHPLNKGREIILTERDTYAPDVCTIVSSGVKGFVPGEVVVLAPDHGAFYPGDRELRIVGVVKPWWESVLGKWSADGFAPAPGCLLVEREMTDQWLNAKKKGFELPDSIPKWSTTGIVLASCSDVKTLNGERICFEHFDFYTFKECLPENWCVVKAKNASKGWLRSLNDKVH